MNATHTIIGLPDAGKTTYLAALWHLIAAAEVDTKLILDRLDGDATYLNEMVESWQRCEKVRRTTSAEDHPVILHLKERTSLHPVVLNFTDLSGEKFEQQFGSRFCSPEYVSEINGDGGLLLFINADRPHKAITIRDTDGLLGEDADDSDGSADKKEVADADQTAEQVEWDPKFVSEQAQLVDLLQCLQESPFYARKRRLAVVVSAWDVVKNRNSAEEWLRHELPFLWQYLSTNKDSFETKMWGVSAQGGVIQNDAQGKVVETEVRTALLKCLPSSRVRCVTQSSTSPDITLPLCWLSGLADA
jgi:hypothetical protein